MKLNGSVFGLEGTKKEPELFSILVVDDEECILAFIKIKLRLSGYRVSAASDGIEALERLKDGIPDLVIMDIVMPRMGGILLFKEIRKFSIVPVIIMSAVDPHDTIVSELREATDDYILKPFNPDELVARIEEIRKHQQYSYEREN
jgi:DNA-binding response OmpR family regulator